ncbi:MAG: RecQ family ATP-dependent DNA helicase [Verrucomicrobiota bacterium]
MNSASLERAITHDPREALERYFGFSDFLAGQTEVVSALLSGRDSLVVMPTGGGKSLCYQLPALVMNGVTLVISPLIALMKDQVDGLVSKGIPATMVNSTLSASEQSARLREVAAGKHKLVYVAPERFRSTSFIRALDDVSIALFAVDEAHCLSQWGHDFRPDYLRLSEAVATLGHPQTAAFTATATPEVRDDILDVLKLRDPFVSISGFERPNLSLAVRHCDGPREKYERIEELIQEHHTGIVYCATRKRVEEVSASLASSKVKLVAYHGGMEERDRSWAQEVFLRREYDVVVATNAFGMGIDRPDVRFVAHFDVPGSVEAYYQEAGRAGRDGEPSVCELMFNYADTRTQEFFIEGNNPTADVIRDVYRIIFELCGPDNEPASMSIKDLTAMLDLKNSMQVSSALSFLLKGGHIERFDVKGQRTRGTRLVDPTRRDHDLEINEEALAEKDRRDHAKLDAMVKFCYDHQTCRQLWILNYFGEADGSACGNCDHCGNTAPTDQREPTDEEFLIVQKALSGVARTCGRLRNGDWEPRFGRTKIVQMLVGSRSSDLAQNRLNELSTFGLLSDCRTSYLTRLFQEIEKAGLIVTRKTPYPLLALTRRGTEVMKGDRHFNLTWPDRGRNSTRDKSAPAFNQLEDLVFDEDLFEELREVRNQLAAEAGGKPAYTIFSNQVLEFFTRLRPQSREQAIQIRGVGEVKADRYLEPFLEVLGKWKRAE